MFTAKQAKDVPFTEEFLKNTVDLVNDAYLRGEAGMWVEPQPPRTNIEEFKKLIDEDKIIVAYQSDSQDMNSPVGSVLCDTKFDESKKLAELGMLCAHKDCLGQGLGKFLVKSAEERAKEMGCEQMRLEILSPTNFQHQMKVRLHGWYTGSLGYTQGEPLDFSIDYPQLANLLQGPTVFTPYFK